jgi:hypothetical protein
MPTLKSCIEIRQIRNLDSWLSYFEPMLNKIVEEDSILSDIFRHLNECGLTHSDTILAGG